MADDDRAVMERLAALEAEVKADAEAQRTRKAAAVAKLRDQRVTQTAAREPGVRKRALRASAVSADDPDDAIDARGARPAARSEPGEVDPLENLSGALELASKANRVKQELQRTPGQGEKSWIKSGVASLALGPVGWLYAGSLREAAPATAAWLVFAVVAKFLPMMLLMPVLMFALPTSAAVGVTYALRYNRTGKRQRLFGGDKTGGDKTDADKTKDKPKQLRSGRTAL